MMSHIAVARKQAAVAATVARRRLASKVGRATTASAACGAAIGGVGGATGGLLAGGALGAAVGLIPAVFTFGLSVPALAIVSGGCGLAAGAAVGSTSGAVAGGVCGHLVFSRLLGSDVSGARDHSLSEF